MTLAAPSFAALTINLDGSEFSVSGDTFSAPLNGSITFVGEVLDIGAPP